MRVIGNGWGGGVSLVAFCVVSLVEFYRFLAAPFRNTAAEDEPTELDLDITPDPRSEIAARNEAHKREREMNFLGNEAHGPSNSLWPGGNDAA